MLKYPRREPDLENCPDSGKRSCMVQQLSKETTQKGLSFRGWRFGDRGLLGESETKRLATSVLSQTAGCVEWIFEGSLLF